MSCPVYLGCCCDVSQGPVGGIGISGFPGLRVSISYHVIVFLMPSRHQLWWPLMRSQFHSFLFSGWFTRLLICPLTYIKVSRYHHWFEQRIRHAASGNPVPLVGSHPVCALCRCVTSSPNMLVCLKVISLEPLSIFCSDRQTRAWKSMLHPFYFGMYTCQSSNSQ